MPTVLIVDDEPNVLYSFRRRLQNEFLDVLTAETGTAGIERVRADEPDAVVLDVRLPDMSGLDAFEKMRAIDSKLPVVIVTAYSTADTAIDAMRRGAFDYLIKPVDIQRLRDVVGRALELGRLSRRADVFPSDTREDSGDDTEELIIGRSEAMQQVYKDIGRVAISDVPVLILGESGTGKELVARAVYQHRHRHDQPFLALNCAALPEGLLESELFGHEQGSFTGAEQQRIGRLEQADGGTLFLDEIGELCVAAQAMLLRFLQDGQFQRVGGRQLLHSNVRIIAATNRDLEAAMEDGHFRSDLYFRLNGYAIRLPALRERPADLPPLVEHYVRRFAPDRIVAVSQEAMAILKSHSWPGNVRELRNAVSHALVQAVSDVITPDSLPPACRVAAQSAEVSLKDVSALTARLLQEERTGIYRELLAEFDRTVFGEVLRAVDGNQVKASERLGVSRTTLRNKLEALGLDQAE